MSPFNQQRGQSPSPFRVGRSLFVYDILFVAYLVGSISLMVPHQKGGYPDTWQTITAYILSLIFGIFTVYQGFIKQQMSFKLLRGTLPKTYYGRKAMYVGVLKLLVIAFVAWMTFLVASPLRNTPLY